MPGAMGIALIVLLAIALGLVVADLYRRARRTRILQVPGGLRFEAQRFSVQVQRSQQELQVHCRRGVLTLPGSAGAEPVQSGAVAHTFAAVGLSVEVRSGTPATAGAGQPGRNGPYDITLRGADGTSLHMARVNASVAASFKLFYLQVRHWIDKLEQRLERERIERLRLEEEAAQALQHAELVAGLQAELLAARPADQALSAADCEALAAAQIASWRQAAGFQGQHSAHQVDGNGHMVWFVDLLADGRITLHAEQRTLHGSLRGASVVAKNGGLEVGLRDAHWTEEAPELRAFQILKGRSAEERRAWKERLEILRNRLDQEALA